MCFGSDMSGEPNRGYLIRSTRGVDLVMMNNESVSLRSI